MHFGLFGINIGACADPAVQRRVAIAAEEAGFESLWTGEHVAMPIHDSPVPAPPETPFLDSIVALAAVAAATTRVRLGTGILVLPHHNPVLLAKALASLDAVSGGRLIAGFAGGYVEAEFRALGVDFRRRGAITDDSSRHARTVDRRGRYAGRFARFAGIR
jgi:alkanesulfonate monooxygenase SsuD/methylene tetrahydromethanopterin reductase-like flavin-dependent oxidoreductase (luciferase family)